MKIRFFAIYAIVAALFGGAAVALPASASTNAVPPASALQVQSSILACNYNAAGMRYFYYSTAGPVVQWPTKYCDGYYTLNSDGHRVEPGDWSGYVDFRDGTWTYFCDRTTRYLGRKRVVGIEMSPVRIFECGGSPVRSGQDSGRSNSGRDIDRLVL